MAQRQRGQTVAHLSDQSSQSSSYALQQWNCCTLKSERNGENSKRPNADKADKMCISVDMCMINGIVCSKRSSAGDCPLRRHNVNFNGPFWTVFGVFLAYTMRSSPSVLKKKSEKKDCNLQYEIYEVEVVGEAAAAPSAYL